MSERWTNTLIGVLVSLAALAGSALALRSEALGLVRPHQYVLTADFPSVGGLKVGAPVEIAGVAIGEVESISLRDYEAHVVLGIERSIAIPDTSVAAIKSHGLIGETFVAITPVRKGHPLPPGGRIRHVVAARDLGDLISSYIFGKV